HCDQQHGNFGQAGGCSHQLLGQGSGQCLEPDGLAGALLQFRLRSVLTSESYRMLIRMFTLMMLLLAVPMAQAERIKDMAQVQGVRTNQLVGYGLVVGLNGTGDQTSQAPFTIQSLTNMLAQMGVVVPPNVTPQLKNVAAVSVNAVMPAFVKPGQTIDITVNSIANAK